MIGKSLAHHRIVENLGAVREATANDAAELARLRWEYRVVEQAGGGRHSFVQECEVWLEQAISSGRWVVAVAGAQDGSLCGCMYLQCVDKVPIPGKIERAWGYVTMSYVSPERRGQGIGRELLDLIINVGRARKLEFLILWPSEKAVSFYERAGFRPASEAHDRPDDHPPLELEL